MCGISDSCTQDHDERSERRRCPGSPPSTEHQYLLRYGPWPRLFSRGRSGGRV
jgi:hypothetical protein